MSLPVIDVWANPVFPLDEGVPEARRLFEQSHADSSLLSQRRTPDELVALMDAAGVSQICLCAWYRPGQAVFSNEDVAQFTRAYPDRFIGIASVNLLDPVGYVKEIVKYVTVEGFKGVRVVPWLWNLPPTDRHYWPLYVKCIELDIPFLTQVGHTGPLCPSEVGRPVPYIDEVALKFPSLSIICGHLGYPWTQEMIGVAWKHPNVYIDTSAYLPKYYPPELIQFANTIGRKKVMFGTNFPQLSWAKCLESVRKDIKLRDEVRADFLGGNAARVLKLDLPALHKGKL
ncbi:amidohydrolase 2 [Aspergillus lentulus]|uniref:Amidohydrolase 2 n=1 Tax=Aspergillus lentulus TaxID=293939 RepID=A0ABQ0ZT71_ASPLE|nr:amidohydrolase 2 [Aspergillus lentulus]GFF68664.1 amidohydrolase 2 [Aspergillus lentulus]GFF77573.1 amidohydrolase 2 [Aspergillus lentulus]GFG14499.1 amidohydrolase 2 [Aspergillus lentulus]